MVSIVLKTINNRKIHQVPTIHLLFAGSSRGSFRAFPTVFAGILRYFLPWMFLDLNISPRSIVSGLVVRGETFVWDSIQHRNKLTAKAWESAVQELGRGILWYVEVTSWLVSADDFSSRVARGANERVSAANE